VAVSLVLMLATACGGEDAQETPTPPAEPRVTPSKTTRAEEPARPAEQEVDLLHAVQTEAGVSSAYRDDVSQVARLFDGDLETTWNSRTGDLAGSWIEISLPEDVTVTAIEITAGYTKVDGDRDLFTGNHPGRSSSSGSPRGASPVTSRFAPPRSR